MRFYIIENGQEIGPLDQLSIVRKIKTGKLTGQTFVRAEDAQQAAPAETIEFLKPFFIEEPAPSRASLRKRRYRFIKLCMDGWEFLTMNQNAVVKTGIFLIIAVLTGLVVSGESRMRAGIALCLIYIEFGVYMFAIAKRSRGHSMEFSELMKHTFSRVIDLLLGAFLVVLPVIAITEIFIVPALEPVNLASLGIAVLLISTVFLFTIFVPLLILEGRVNGFKAILKSLGGVARLGPINTVVLLELIMLNTLGIAGFFPLLVTLPMSIAAITTMYDDLFHA